MWWISGFDPVTKRANGLISLDYFDDIIVEPTQNGLWGVVGYVREPAQSQVIDAFPSRTDAARAIGGIVVARATGAAGDEALYLSQGAVHWLKVQDNGDEEDEEEEDDEDELWKRGGRWN